MSELKDYKVYTTRSVGAWGFHYDPNPNKDSSDIELNGKRVYLKREADKVIAKKDAKILALDAEVVKQKHHAKLFLDERNYAETQLRHQKYKRCLAMARWCEKAYWQCPEYKERFYERWKDIWLALAEKFKEAK